MFSQDVRSGDKIIIIRRPSMVGLDSILLMSDNSLAKLVKRVSPCSVYSISRPRNWTVAFTLSPPSRNSLACLVLKSRSWSSVVGRKRSSFTCIICCFFLASFSFFFFSYMNLPKSIPLQTGGRALGAISTKSRLYDRAICRARSISAISCSSSGVMTLTFEERISSLIFGRSSLRFLLVVGLFAIIYLCNFIMVVQSLKNRSFIRFLPYHKYKNLE